MKKKVLIISYTFPPYPGIGGRRWAKFAKYLAQKDYEVHVICAKNIFEESSQWAKDIEHPNIKVNTLPVKYPRVLLRGTKNIYGKIIYRFWKAFLSLYSKGTLFEKTIFWQRQLLQKASQLIEREGIINVIVSIPPYRLAHHAALIKKKYPHINLIVDYRDPWSDNKSYQGFKNLHPERLKYEQQLEKEVLTIADNIITVSGKMTDTLKTICTHTEKIVTIPNGFDPADIVSFKKEDSKANGEKLKLIYAGTVYSDLEYIIDPLLAYLKKIKHAKGDLYNRISFEFYGNHNPEFVAKIKKFNENTISIYEPLPLPEIQAMLKSSNFCVLMSASNHSFAFNTKFCEYLANRKPILLFSYPGETSNFLLSNKLGFLINPSTLEKDMNTFFAEMQNITLKYNFNFNIDAFSIPLLTTQVEKLLK